MDSITAQPRKIMGKKVSSLRKEGLLPAVVYGKGKEAESITVSQGEFLKVWKSAGESSLVALSLDNKEHNVLIHDVALDPIKNLPVHADFYLVDMKKEVEVDVPLEFTGEAEAGKSGLGVLVKVMHELKIKALPKDLPHSIVINVAALQNPGQTFAVRDVVAPAGVTLLNTPEETIALVEEMRKEEVSETAAPSTAEAIQNIEVVKEKKATEESEEGEKAE